MLLTDTSKAVEKASVPLQFIRLRKYVLVEMLVVYVALVFVPAAEVQVTPSGELCQSKTSPVPVLAPVTDKVNVPPVQKLPGPDVVPPTMDPGKQGVGGIQV